MHLDRDPTNQSTFLSRIDLIEFWFWIRDSTNQTAQIWIQSRLGGDAADVKRVWRPDPRNWHTGSLAGFTRPRSSSSGSRSDQSIYTFFSFFIKPNMWSGKRPPQPLWLLRPCHHHYRRCRTPPPPDHHHHLNRNATFTVSMCSFGQHSVILWIFLVCVLQPSGRHLRSEHSLVIEKFTNWDPLSGSTPGKYRLGWSKY